MDGFEHVGSVRVTYRSFVLKPDAPRDFGGSAREFLSHTSVSSRQHREAQHRWPSHTTGLRSARRSKPARRSARRARHHLPLEDREHVDCRGATRTGTVGLSAFYERRSVRRGQPAMRYWRRASRTTSDVVVSSATARSSTALRSSGSSRTGRVSAGPDPMDGRPGRRRSLDRSSSLSASAAKRLRTSSVSSTPAFVRPADFFSAIGSSATSRRATRRPTPECEERCSVRSPESPSST